MATPEWRYLLVGNRRSARIFHVPPGGGCLQENRSYTVNLIPVGPIKRMLAPCGSVGRKAFSPQQVAHPMPALKYAEYGSPVERVDNA